jgi:hypothetical protein
MMEQIMNDSSPACSQSVLADRLDSMTPTAWMYKNAYTEDWYLKWTEDHDRHCVPLYTPEQIAEIVASEHRCQRLLEDNCRVLQRELAEMQELCDDLITSLIEATSLANCRGGPRNLLEAAMDRIESLALRKPGPKRGANDA